MACEAVLLLNRLLQLALVDDTTAEARPDINGLQGSRLASDWASKRCHYVRDLRCVQSFRSLVLDPQTSMHMTSLATAYG